MTSIDDVRSIDLQGRDGLRLRADEFGDPDGPVVVLLHGGGQTRFAWGSTARVLAERGWHVYRVDLRGHGESDWPDDGDYGPEAFAGDVYEIARSFPEPPVLVESVAGVASPCDGTRDLPARTTNRWRVRSCWSTWRRRSNRTAPCASARS